MPSIACCSALFTSGIRAPALRHEVKPRTVASLRRRPMKGASGHCFLIGVRQKLMGVVRPKWDFAVCFAVVSSGVFFVQERLAHCDHIRIAVQIAASLHVGVALFLYSKRLGVGRSYRWCFYLVRRSISRPQVKLTVLILRPKKF